MRRYSGSRVRLGRSSFGRYRSGGVSDGGDCTSSSEQSCDTVIYLGASASSLSTSSSDHHPRRSREPRGLADGSDWQRQLLYCSADEKQFIGSGEEEAEVDGGRTLEAKGRSGIAKYISFSEGGVSCSAFYTNPLIFYLKPYRTCPS